MLPGLYSFIYSCNSNYTCKICHFCHSTKQRKKKLSMSSLLMYINLFTQSTWTVKDIIGCKSSIIKDIFLP